MWGPQPISIVQQREVKRDPIVSGEKIQIGFDLNVSKESRTFQATVRAKTAEDSVNYFGDRFSSASHILCLHLRPRSDLINRRFHLINLCFVRRIFA